MDLTFLVAENKKFNVRSAAIIKYQDNFFLSKREDKDYYSIPGGRVSFGEDSKSTIIRELKEELDFDIPFTTPKLLRIVENFFQFKDGTFFHEYLFIYEIEVPAKYFAKGDFINLENPAMHMKWYQKEDFLKLNVKPKVVKECLSDNSFKHLILKEL